MVLSNALALVSRSQGGEGHVAGVDDEAWLEEQLQLLLERMLRLHEGQLRGAGGTAVEVRDVARIGRGGPAPLPDHGRRLFRVVAVPVDDVDELLARVRERGYVTTLEIFAALPNLDLDVRAVADFQELHVGLARKIRVRLQ